jgi:hypothetical protein
MLHTKHQKKSMAKRSKTKHADADFEKSGPRMSKSARIAELNSVPGRIPDLPALTVPATVVKIVPSDRASHPQKAEIAVDWAVRPYRDLRIENSLTNEHGDEVRLKKGVHVDVTITAKEDS